MIVLKEKEHYKGNIYWLKRYITLFISTSFFNTCIEFGIEKVEQGVHKMYITNSGSYRHQRINDLLKVCYPACAKCNDDFDMLENLFANRMINGCWDLTKFFDKYRISNYFNAYFPGLPEELPKIIFETKLLGIEKIPEEIPDEINCKELVTYILNTIWLIAEQDRDYLLSSDDLLLKHFFNHDILLGVDSKDEHYFVKKKIENRTLLSNVDRTLSPIIGKVNMADLKLASEIIIKYKQPGRFSYFSSQSDKVYQKFAGGYENFTFQQSLR
jgi:hypothetical protein